MKNATFTITILILLFLGNFTKAQLTMHKMISAGYTYQNQSFGEVGGKLLFLSNDNVIYRLGGSAMMGSVNSEFAIMPKVSTDILLNFQKNVDFYHSYYFLMGAEATNKYIAPKVGFTLFGLLDLTGGYAFPVGNSGINGKELRGLNINFTLNLPTAFIHDMFN
ncbi:hypothetical protein MKJ01_11955 [Chryseobacterium sp. SSA4.19]|uniref:hypothetical protein n=1 Tax=Chryseobacterium sp. SSA4.19 TaxID=2919915 RepID=UPI001F4EB5BE|nr:hypothetical protein [Chryseobacterium sp. SSA4.19]MCJ8154477.1 hypothetical protein [Chryseobacterium sp. SSA4.19]